MSQIIYRVIYRVTTWVLWMLDGRPRSRPVVVKAGELLIDSEGVRSFSEDWDFDYSYLTAPVPTSEVWESLAAEGFPVRRT